MDIARDFFNKIYFLLKDQCRIVAKWVTPMHVKDIGVHILEKFDGFWKFSAPEILQRPAPKPGALLFGSPRPERLRAPANAGQGKAALHC